jgi:hypothetical protein
MIRTYSELVQLKTFDERYQYLRIGGKVGEETFGIDRYLNQMFYSRDPEWLAARDEVIIRDNGCDLGMDGYDIVPLNGLKSRNRNDYIIVHHINPITIDDIKNRTIYLLSPEFLISTRDSTHRAIHYGDENQLIRLPPARSRNDTCPWRH